MKKIVIALDSFKGCLTSAEAGEAAAQGVHAACPECRTIVLPVADGGEGMLDVLLAASKIPMGNVPLIAPEWGGRYRLPSGRIRNTNPLIVPVTPG